MNRMSNLMKISCASIVAAARGLWTASLGAGDPRLAILEQVTILVSDLPEGMLGATTGTTIVIDGSAAGWGWFVDPTRTTFGWVGLAQAAGRSIPVMLLASHRADGAVYTRRVPKLPMLQQPPLRLFQPRPLLISLS